MTAWTVVFLGWHIACAQEVVPAAETRPTVPVAAVVPAAHAAPSILAAWSQVMGSTTATVDFTPAGIQAR
jgi:hypothetical protein